ncbi:MAG: hypothetical protein OEW16_01740 [Gammaproteobacteria bacterium]|nr:hypothetical protein [Gammaproteobacteria bacterium]
MSLAIIIFAGLPWEHGAAQTKPRARASCTSATECLNRAKEAAARKVAAQRKLAEAEKRLKNPPPPKQVCMQTSAGTVCSTSSPMITDDRPSIREEITWYSDEESQYYALANQYQSQGQTTTAPSSSDRRASSSASQGAAKSCFIATAAYGTSLAEEVLVLRDFRDRRLLSHPAGRRFVELYETYSPPLAEYIAKSDSARAATRAALWPIAKAVRYPLSAVLCLLSVTFGAVMLRRALKPRGAQVLT